MLELSQRANVIQTPKKSQSITRDGSSLIYAQSTIQGDDGNPLSLSISEVAQQKMILCAEERCRAVVKYIPDYERAKALGRLPVPTGDRQANVRAVKEYMESHNPSLREDRKEDHSPMSFPEEEHSVKQEDWDFDNSSSSSFDDGDSFLIDDDIYAINRNLDD